VKHTFRSSKFNTMNKNIFKKKTFPNLHSLLNVTIQSYHTTRSSVTITLQRPLVRSCLKITNRSFTHHAPVLWNSLPKQLRQPSAPPSLGIATVSSPLLAQSSHQFQSKLKTFLFEQSFPP